MLAKVLREHQARQANAKTENGTTTLFICFTPKDFKESGGAIEDGSQLVGN